FAHVDSRALLADDLPGQERVVHACGTEHAPFDSSGREPPPGREDRDRGPRSGVQLFGQGRPVVAQVRSDPGKQRVRLRIEAPSVDGSTSNGDAAVDELLPDHGIDVEAGPGLEDLTDMRGDRRDRTNWTTDFGLPDEHGVAACADA